MLTKASKTFLLINLCFMLAKVQNPLYLEYTQKWGFV